MSINRSITVEISTENVGESKQFAKFSMDNVSELERIVVIQSIFKAINVESDLSSMVDDYVKLGKAYQDFFKVVNTDEEVVSKKDKNKIKKNKTKGNEDVLGDEIIGKLIKVKTLDANDDQITEIISENMSAPITVQTDEVEISNLNNENSKNHNDIPEHFKTGIRITPSGKFYQCRLHCTRCKNKKTHYIRETDVTINCKFCSQVHGVRKATQEKLVPDFNNNFFVAGDFVAEHEKISSLV